MRTLLPLLLFSLIGLNRIYSANSVMHDNEDEVMETQHATCNVTTEELAASAQATVTRVLTGVCNARETNERFDKLESDLKERLSEIKRILNAISQQSTEVRFEEQGRLIDRLSRRAEVDSITPRQDEIDRLNDTVRQIFTINGPVKTLIYYWRITAIDEKLSHSGPNRSQISPMFYVNQKYAVYLRLVPGYLTDNSIFVSLGVTHDHYDPAIFEWSDFPFKICIEILDHSAEDQREDRSSGILDPSTFCSWQFSNRSSGKNGDFECVGLIVPIKQIFLSYENGSYENVKSRSRYIWNNSLTIKLTVYL